MFTNTYMYATVQPFM